MSRIITKRINRSQLEKMAGFLEKYPQLSNGSSEKIVPNGYKDKIWRELADILNAEPLGAKKSPLKWRKCLRDYKCHVKKKYLQYLADSSNMSPLTYLDVRYLGIMGYVVDIEDVVYSNSDNVKTYLQLDEGSESPVADVTIFPKNKEPKQKFYHAPEIITILPSLEFKATGDQTPTMEHSRVKEEAHENLERPSNKGPSNIERPENNEPSNVQRPQNNGLSTLESTNYIKSSVKRSSLDPKISPNKKLSLSKKTSGAKTKNATAVALHAIAIELGAKNKLTKRKIELEKEKLQLEKRKIEAFELIAKRLYRR